MCSLQPPVASIHDHSEIPWLTASAWLGLHQLAEVPEFASFMIDAESNQSRFKEVSVRLQEAELIRKFHDRLFVMLFAVVRLPNAGARKTAVAVA